MQPPRWSTAYTQARALCQQVGETPQLFPVLFGLWRFYRFTAAVARRRANSAKHLLRLAQHADDPALAVIAHYALGATWFCLGAFPAAPHSIWRKASHATRQTSAVRWCSAWATTRVLAAASMPL